LGAFKILAGMRGGCERSQRGEVEVGSSVNGGNVGEGSCDN